MTNGKWDLLASEPIDELRRRCGRELVDLASRRIVKNRAILCDDSIEQIDAVESIEQVGELPASDEQQGRAGFAYASQCVDGLLIDAPLEGDRAVVIGGQHLILHRTIRHTVGGSASCGSTYSSQRRTPPSNASSRRPG